MIGRSLFDSRQKTNNFSLLHHQVSEIKSPGRKPHPTKPTIAKANKNSCSSGFSHATPPLPISSGRVVQIIARTNLRLYTLKDVDSSALTLAFGCIQIDFMG
jgi:hypothetical protein